MTHLYKSLEGSKLISTDRKQARGCLRLGVRRMIAKGRKRTFLGDENVLCVDCGGGYMNVYVCQNGCILLYVKLCLNQADKENLSIF